MISLDVQKRIWDRVQVKRIYGHDMENRRRLNKIIKDIKRLHSGLPRNVNILNVGVGNGQLEKFLNEQGFNIYSLDPSENAIDALVEHHNFPADHAYTGSAADMSFSSAFFDFIVMSEVLEHLDDVTLHKALSELQRTLKPGGYFIGTCPDNEDLVLNSFTCPYCSKYSHRVGHIHSFTTQTLAILLSRHFEIIKCYSFLGMNVNWKGLLLHHWIDTPFKIARIFKPNVRSPRQIEFNIYFRTRNRSTVGRLTG